MATTIKLNSQSLETLTPSSSASDKHAAYNQLLRLRDGRDRTAERLAGFTRRSDKAGIEMTAAALARIEGDIAAAEAKLIECGVITGATSAPAVPENKSTVTTQVRNRQQEDAIISAALSAGMAQGRDNGQLQLTGSSQQVAALRERFGEQIVPVTAYAPHCKPVEVR